MGPVSSLLPRFNSCNWVSWPSSGGRGPVSRLSARCRVCSRVSRPNAEGTGRSGPRPPCPASVPSISSVRAIFTTRGGVPPTSTPWNWCTGVSGPQEKKRRSSLRSRVLRTASRSSLSQARLGEGPWGGQAGAAGPTRGVGGAVGDNVGVGVGVKVSDGVATGMTVATGGTGDGVVATARSVATSSDLRAAQPARHRSGNRTASNSQTRRGRKASIGLANGMARRATQGGCADDPGLYAGRSQPCSQYARVRTPDSRSARGRRPFEIARKARLSAANSAPAASGTRGRRPAASRTREFEAQHLSCGLIRGDRPESTPSCEPTGRADTAGDSGSEAQRVF